MGTSTDFAKNLAALAAAAELPHEGVIGLGSGSTARLFIDEVGKLIRGGRRYRAVATSQASRQQAEALGIELLPDDGPWSIDVTIDGADEVDANLNLIKGGGACQTREKIVNHSSRRNIIIVDESKLSSHLGTKWPVPLEVLAFGHASTARHLEAWGRPVLRRSKEEPVRTDSGNLIYDLEGGIIEDPAALDAALRAVPGVVETGLFVGRADLVIVAGSAGVRKLTPNLSPRPTH